MKPITVPKQEVLRRNNGLHSFDTTDSTYTRKSPVVACVFVAAVTFSPALAYRDMEHKDTQTNGRDS
jgi:hypothetical protein